MQKITTFLTFESRGLEAANFYVSIFKNSKLDNTMVVPGSDTLLFADFTLDGQKFMAMDGGLHFKFEQGISLFVTCDTQLEVDYFWDKLGAGGEYLQCGWLKDKFGISWQIVPTALGKLMGDADPKKAKNVMDAMLQMNKIDIEGLKRAHEQPTL